VQTISVTGHLLGSVAFTRDGRSLALPPSSASLLAYLLLRPRGEPVNRSRLADVIVDETGSESTLRRRLNTAVWRLRRSLEPDGVPRDSVLTSIGHGLAVSSHCEVWVDAREFENACLGMPPFDRWVDADAERLADAVRLYRGGFLDGLYTDWALAERGRLADLHLAALVRLAQWFQRRGDPERALRHALSAVAAEPLREDLHRLVIELYAEAGLPQLARQQLEHCRAVLTKELGIEPLPETMAAVRVGAHADAGQSVEHYGPRRRDHYDAAIRELERSREELHQMSVRLDRSLRALRRDRYGADAD
jgi:DNA-binding SARP family transcriptional activator